MTEQTMPDMSPSAEIALLRRTVHELTEQIGRASAEASEVVGRLERELAKVSAAFEELRASEAELRAIVAALDDLIIVLNGEGRYLEIMPSRPELLYRRRDELLGKTLHDLLPKDRADLLLESVRRALTAGASVSVEYSLPIDGKELWFLATILPMADGRVVFLARNVTARKEADEALRQRIRHEEVIRAQSLALAELSTPLIPITDDIVVMPLIGVLDAQRVQQATATLLSGIGARRACVAILDITGVSVVDSRVAEGLLRAARAAELLGAQAVLTGIRSDVARTLVGLGVDLGRVVTRGTLQDGIAFALRRSRRWLAAR